MSDPPRLLETNSTEADLLEAWSSMRGPADGRAKALALAGLTVGATATAVGASIAAKSAVGASVAGSSAGAVGAGVTVAASTGVAAGAGTTVASATATGAGLLATKWLAAIGVVAVLGGGGVVAAKKMSAPTHDVAIPTERAQAETAAPSGKNNAKPAEKTTNPPDPRSPSADAPVMAAGDLPNADAPEAERVHSATTGDGKTAKGETAKPARTVRGDTATGSGKTKGDLATGNGGRTKGETVKPATAEPAPVASTLGAEVSALDAARNALRSGDPARALRELDAFDAKHPGSALSEDAAFLRFDANVALGDRAGADKAARNFLARYPSSPRAAKVKRWLDGGAN